MNIDQTITMGLVHLKGVRIIAVMFEGFFVIIRQISTPKKETTPGYVWSRGSAASRVSSLVLSPLLSREGIWSLSRGE